MTASKQRGTRWESAIVAYLIDRGWTQTERRTLSGARDRGDIAGIPGVVIEAKDQKRMSLAEWLDEATVETANAHARIGVVWFKRRGKTSPGSGYVVMSGDTFTQLLKAAGW
jgi:hypothetical protein